MFLSKEHGANKVALVQNNVANSEKYLIVASSFNRWAGPNNPLLDLCNYLYNEAKINLTLLTHEANLSNDFFDWARFPIVPILSGSSSDARTRLISAFPNVKRIQSLIKSLKVNREKIFVNASIDTLFSTHFAIRSKIATGYNVFNNDLCSPFFNTLDHIAAKTIVRKILAHTDFQKGLYKRAGVDEKRIQVIPHCIDINRVQRMASYGKTDAERHPVIFFCGRLTPEKGINLLLDSHLKVSEKIQSTLVIVGDGPMREFVLAKKKQVERTTHGKVDYLGPLPPQVFLSKMNNANVVVVPSLEERFGMVILEAMCLEKTVIASEIGGVPEIVTNQENGVLVKPNDANGIAEAIIKVLTNDRESRKIAREGFQTVKKYSVERIAPAWLNFMDGCYEGKLGD